MNKKIIFSVLILGLLVVGVAYFSSSPTPVAAQGAGEPLTGWGWSSNIGWVSFNCKTAEGVATEADCAKKYWVANNAGVLNGYAWSSNIGWIDFGPSGGYPSGNGTQAVSARLTTNGDGLIGWARACSVFVDTDNCAGTLKPAEDRGGWDGWISMAGTSVAGGTYGVTRAPAGENAFRYSGYAWGSLVTGWLTFDTTQSNPDDSCNPAEEVCEPDGGGITLICDVDDESPDPGQRVTWTAEASGGDSPYTYCWGADCDPSVGGNVDGIGDTVEIVVGPTGTRYDGVVKATDDQGRTKEKTCNTVIVGSPQCPTDWSCAVWGPSCAPGQTGSISQTCQDAPSTIPSGCPTTRQYQCSSTPPDLDILGGVPIRILQQREYFVSTTPDAQLINNGDLGTFCIDSILSQSGNGPSLLDIVQNAPNGPHEAPRCYLWNPDEEAEPEEGAGDPGSCNPAAANRACVELDRGEIANFRMYLTEKLQDIRDDGSELDGMLDYHFKFAEISSGSEEVQDALVFLDRILGVVVPR